MQRTPLWNITVAAIILLLTAPGVALAQAQVESIALGTRNGLQGVSLEGNLLSGCLPVAWSRVAHNDLDEVGLPFCAE